MLAASVHVVKIRVVGELAHALRESAQLRMATAAHRALLILQLSDERAISLDQWLHHWREVVCLARADGNVPW